MWCDARCREKVGDVKNRAGTHIQPVERSWREFRRLVPKFGIKKGSVGTKLSKFAFYIHFSD